MSKVFAVTRRAPGDISNRVIPFILSTADEDRVGDTIDQTGWKLDNYLKNPVVLWCHDQSVPPIGKCVSLGIESGALVGRVEFATAEQHPLAETIFKLAESGFVSAGSVGFRPIKFEINEGGGLDFKEQELLEFSIVGVPCNPAALARVKAEGFDLDAATAVLRDFAPDSERAALIEAARKQTPRKLPRMKAAVDLRSKEFQLGRLRGA